MKTICFSSIKGGTGKSSLCILTANYAASAGYRVLVADLDIQNSATSYYLDSPEEADRRNIAAVFHTERIPENIIPSNYAGIDLLASSLDLVKFRAIGDRTLKRILTASALAYDFLFIDTAPTYDNIVLNALNASDLIITPVAFSQFDYKGALFYEAQLKRETDKLSAWRILFNFHRPARTENPDALRNQYEALFRGSFGDIIAPVTIPDTALIRRAIDTGESITASQAKAPLHAAITVPCRLLRHRSHHREVLAMPKLTMTTRPEKASVNNSGDKTVGVELYLDQITKAEPFASLFTIKAEVFEAIKADMKANGFDPSKPVNVWRKPDGTRILIDGYTRVRAAEELGLLRVTAYEKTFASEAEALAYAIHTQRDRRNLSDAELLAAHRAR